jgi:hypothetical protein
MHTSICQIKCQTSLSGLTGPHNPHLFYRFQFGARLTLFFHISLFLIYVWFSSSVSMGRKNAASIRMCTALLTAKLAPSLPFLLRLRYVLAVTSCEFYLCLFVGSLFLDNDCERVLVGSDWDAGSRCGPIWIGPLGKIQNYIVTRMYNRCRPISYCQSTISVPVRRTCSGELVPI